MQVAKLGGDGSQRVPVCGPHRVYVHSAQHFLIVGKPVQLHALHTDGDTLSQADDALTCVVAGVLIVLFVALSASILACSYYLSAEPQEVCQ